MAVLNANVLHLAREVRDLKETVCADLNDKEKRLRDAEKWGETSKERWRQHEEDHKTLSVKNWALDIVGSVAAFVGASLLGKT